MQLGIGTYTFGWAVSAGGSFDELALLERAVSLGISLVQLGDNLPLHSFSAERLEVFKDMSREKGIKIEVGARGLTTARLQRYIRICGELDAGILRIVIDDGEWRPPVEEVIRLVRQHLDQLEKQGLVLAIENHDRMGSLELAGIIDAVGSPRVGICLDTVNSMGAGEGIEEVIERLGPYTMNLHIKDFGIRRPEHKQGFIIDGRIAGEGMLDIPRLLRRINVYQRCQTCILEQWAPFGDNIAETIATERSWAEKGVANLKRMGI